MLALLPQIVHHDRFLQEHYFQHNYHDLELHFQERRSPIQEHCPFHLIQKQKVVLYPSERNPYTSNFEVQMSPQQERLELLLSPPLSENEMELIFRKLELPKNGNNPFYNVFILMVLDPLTLARNSLDVNKMQQMHSG